MNRETVKIIWKQENIENVCSKITSSSSGFVVIGKGDWQNIRMPQICSYIQQWQIKQSLWASKNNHSKILLEIVNIGFPYLQQLYLNDNLIETIESIARLWAPLLLVLWIQNNMINSLKSLRKANFKELSWIRISKNYVNEVSSLSQMDLSVINQLGFELNKFCQVQVEDLRPILKFSVNSTEEQTFMHFFSDSRIRQNSVDSKIKKKFLGVYVNRNPVI